MASWSAAKQAGLALAALLRDDRELAQAAPALPAALVAQVRARLAPGDARPQATRVAELLAEVRPPLAQLERQLPPRLASLVAAKLPRSLARQVAAATPPARPGFVPHPDLLPVLLRIARRAARAAIPEAHGPATRADVGAIRGPHRATTPARSAGPEGDSE